MPLRVGATSSLCFAVIVALSSAAPFAGSIHPRVRGTTPAAQSLLEAGARRSATFAALMRAVDATDVVVLVELTRDLPQGVEGRLVFVTCAGGVRYLRAQLSSALGTDGVIAVAGHELQHAIEVAAHPDVRDSGTMAALYRRIGVPGAAPNRYDTAEALSIGRRVRAELD